MQFSVLFALALSVIGVMAAPVEQRNVECRGILNGDIRKFYLYTSEGILLIISIR
jgi:hypothetical protein